MRHVRGNIFSLVPREYQLCFSSTYVKSDDSSSTSSSTSTGSSSSSGSSGGSSSSSTTVTNPTSSTPDVNTDILNTEAAAATTNQLLSTIDTSKAEIPRIDNVDTVEEEAILNQVKAAQEEQAIKSADYNVNTSISELQRTEQDAQEDYQTQRNQVAADEQRALDNQVLYAASRGDNGGIGQAQYGTIQNTAATNQLSINKEQTKLATDTQRQIADLRAQGEFEKADQLLSISQNYLSQLMTLKQWAKETNVGIDEFNAQLAEWEANYQMSLFDANISAATATGAFSNGTPTYTAWMQSQEQVANVANALMNAGVIPSAEQLASMGFSTDQANAYVNYMKNKGLI